MVVNLSPVGGAAAQFFDNNGNPLTGGKLYTYLAGTTTPAATYTTFAGITAHTNPIVLNSAGRIPSGGEVWIDNLTSYKFVLEDSNNVLIATYDNIASLNSAATGYTPGPNSLLTSTTVQSALDSLSDESSGSSVVGFIQTGAGVVATTAQNKLRQIVSVIDFGAVADGNLSADTGTDNSAAFNAALAHASLIGAGSVYIPNGNYKLFSAVTIPQGVTLRGAGRHCTTLFAPASFNTTGGIINFGVGTVSHGLCDLALLAPPGGIVGTGTSGVGIFANRNGTFIERIWVSGFNVLILIENTDVFVLDSVIEECTAGGIGIDMNSFANDVNIANCVLYNLANTSIRIQDGLNTDGTINIDNVRMLAVRTTGIQILNSSVPVQISNCSAAGLSEVTNVTGSGIAVDDSSNVSISNFVCRVGTNARSASGVGIRIVNGSSNVTIVGGQIQSMLDGIQSTGSNDIVITGVNCSFNSRRGIYINGGGRVTVTGAHCYDNGTVGGTTDAGIFDTNNTANASHIFTGCHTSQDGGGVQDYGFFVDVGDATCISNLTGCMALNNNTANFSENGIVANINRSDSTINISGSITASGGTAIPIGGALQTGLLVSTTPNFGVLFGSGPPLIAAAKGSLYLRSDGTGTGDRAYIATDASGTWTAITTVA